jgi:hypothetical protein
MRTSRTVATKNTTSAAIGIKRQEEARDTEDHRSADEDPIPVETHHSVGGKYAHRTDGDGSARQPAKRNVPVIGAQDQLGSPVAVGHEGNDAAGHGDSVDSARAGAVHRRE